MKEQGNPMTSAPCRDTRSEDSNLFKVRAGQGKGREGQGKDRERAGKGQGRRGKARENTISAKPVEGNQRCLNSVIPFFREIQTVCLPQCPALVFPLCLTLLLSCQS